MAVSACVALAALAVSITRFVSHEWGSPLAKRGFNLNHFLAMHKLLRSIRHI
jgi:hypothetical protein